MSKDNNNINKSIAKGAIWMLLMRLCIKGIAVISTLILVRLLVPEDFGIMVMATSVIALVDLIRAFGFDTVLIQKQDAQHSHYDTAWTMQVIFALIASGILVILSGPAANYYEDIRLVNVLHALAINIMLNGFTNIGVVEFRKQLNFNREFNYNVLIKLSGFCTTIPLAWYWHSYWALLVGILSGNIMSLILSYSMQPYRPRISLKEWRELLGFSSWLLFNNVLLFLSQHAQNFILGKLSTSSEVGLLAVSNEISTITSAEIVASINRGAYPGYSKVADEKEKLKASFIVVFSNIILIALPCAIGIAAIAPLFVPVLLGVGWGAATEIIQISALTSAMIAFSNSTHYIYLAQARQKIISVLTVTGLLIFIPLLWVFVPQYGALGVVYSLLLSTLFMFPTTLYVLTKQISLRWRELLSISYRPIISAVIMGIFIEKIVFLIGEQQSNIIGVIYLLGIIALGGLVYATVLLIIWQIAGKPLSAEKYAIDLIQRKLKHGNSS